MTELVDSSYKYFFEDEFEKFVGEPNSVVLDECGTKSVVQICPVHQSFQSSLSLAMGKLQDAKSVIDQFGFHSDDLAIPTENEIVMKEAKLSDTLKSLLMTLESQ